jgi:hypothetical protein
MTVVYMLVGRANCHGSMRHDQGLGVPLKRCWYCFPQIQLPHGVSNWLAIDHTYQSDCRARSGQALS